MYTINTQDKFYSFCNGHKCKIVNTKREDGYFECYVFAFSIFVLLRPSELEEDI
jgi:hypothetical protein